MDIDFFDYLE